MFSSYNQILIIIVLMVSQNCSLESWAGQLLEHNTVNIHEWIYNNWGEKFVLECSLSKPDPNLCSRVHDPAISSRAYWRRSFSAKNALIGFWGSGAKEGTSESTSKVFKNLHHLLPYLLFTLLVWIGRSSMMNYSEILDLKCHPKPNT